MKVLFLDENHPILEEKLAKAGMSIFFDTKSSKEEVMKGIGDYQGMIIRSRIPIDKQFLKATTNLKFIGRVGAGMENIDIDFALGMGIKLFNVPEGNRDAVAEHALGMLLMLFNKLNRIDQEVRNGVWKREENRGVELKGKTVGLLGYGFMGRAFARRLIGFGVEVICYDILANIGDEYAKQVSLEQFFNQTDVLSIHLPLTNETNKLVDKKYIESFANPIYIINTARGKCLPLKDLWQSIENGKVNGACLDVLELEKSSFENTLTVKDEKLAGLFMSNKVVFSPHVAGWTAESKYKLASFLADKIVDEFVNNR